MPNDFSIVLTWSYCLLSNFQWQLGIRNSFDVWRLFGAGAKRRVMRRSGQRSALSFRTVHRKVARNLRLTAPLIGNKNRRSQFLMESFFVKIPFEIILNLQTDTETGNSFWVVATHLLWHRAMMFCSSANATTDMQVIR
jgi:hypothetical protein